MKKYLLFIALSAGPPAAYTQAGNLDGTYSAAALSVFVSDSDVYVAGQESNGSGNTIAKIWEMAWVPICLIQVSPECIQYL